MGFSTTSYYYHHKNDESKHNVSQSDAEFLQAYIFFLHWSIIVLLLPLLIFYHVPLNPKHTSVITSTHMKFILQ